MPSRAWGSSNCCVSVRQRRTLTHLSFHHMFCGTASPRICLRTVRTFGPFRTCLGTHRFRRRRSTRTLIRRVSERCTSCIIRELRRQRVKVSKVLKMGCVYACMGAHAKKMGIFGFSACAYTEKSLFYWRCERKTSLAPIEKERTKWLRKNWSRPRRAA